MNENYDEKIHRIGRIFCIIALGFMLSVPLIVCIYFNIFPPAVNLIKGLLTVCIMYIPICAAEFATYTPMLGSNGSYLVFVTGNLTNLKIPCALTCMENNGVKPQTDEGEVIAGISVAVSSIVTMLVIFIGMLALVPLGPVLNAPELKPAFENILPALFGALGAYWIQKQWKLAIVPVVIVIALFALIKMPTGAEGILVPVMGVISVLSARFMYSKKWLENVG